MQKIAKVAMVASALFVPHVANAAPPTGTFYGEVQIIKGNLNAFCNIDITINGSATEATVAMLPGSWSVLCDFITFNNQPYTIVFTETYPGSGYFWIYDVDVDPIVYGGCYDDIAGTWSGTTLYIDSVLSPKIAGTGNCSIVGDVEKEF